MGFLNNLADEFGAKTGKALGNKLYGKHADDLRVGVSESNQSSSGASKRDLELAEIESRNRLKEMKAEETQELKKEIKMITFSTTDITENFNKLDTLLPYIEMNPDDFEEDMALVVKAAQSKFKTGMAMCKSIDPNNPVIQYLESEQEEKKIKREEDAKKKKKSTRRLLIGLILVPVICFLLLSLLAS